MVSGDKKKRKCMHMLRVRGLRDKYDCCGSRPRSRVQGLCAVAYGAATSDLSRMCFFFFMYRAAACYDRCVIESENSIGGCGAVFKHVFNTRVL